MVVGDCDGTREHFQAALIFLSVCRQAKRMVAQAIAKAKVFYGVPKVLDTHPDFAFGSSQTVDRFPGFFQTAKRGGKTESSRSAKEGTSAGLAHLRHYIYIVGLIRKRSQAESVTS
jgi:hypothetical protein